MSSENSSNTRCRLGSGGALHFITQGRYAGSFDELGLAEQFPGGLRNGYVYSISAPDDLSSFRAEGAPAAAGITGSVACGIDQTGQLICEPVEGADEARKHMFANINRRAAQTIGNLLAQAPFLVNRAIENLQSSGSPARVFSQLDADGDGELTINEALNSAQTNSNLMGDLLPYIREQMRLGLAGEDANSIPGVRLAGILAPSPTHDAVFVDARITNGTRHSGEAEAVRNRFARLEREERAALVDFLNSLVTFPPDDTASNLDPGNRNAAGFPQFGHGSVKLAVLFNNPSDAE